MNEDQEQKTKLATAEKPILRPLQAVVQLDRFAMKFLDNKGALGYKYAKIYDSISWGEDLTPSPSPSFSDMLIIEDKKNKAKISVSFWKFQYFCEILDPKLQYFANDVVRWTKNVDQEILSVEDYNRWGIRIWYEVPEEFVKFLFGNVFKLNQTKLNSIKNEFEPDNCFLRFSGKNITDNLQYWLHLSKGFGVERVDTQKPSNNLITIDIDCYREKIKGLAELQGTIQACINLSNKLSEKFLNEVLQ